MIELDKTLFLFFNSFNSPFWDRFMWIVSARLIWVPLYLFMLVLLGFKERRKLLVLLPLLIITVILCDQISVLFKNDYVSQIPEKT